mmetsp:Transcript_56159/g.64098  ORF Transcript_56159/g.64098 Transcript_56159/m.64098 type:complete len:296 (+) Transcript_56159:70-957(+)
MSRDDVDFFSPLAVNTDDQSHPFHLIRRLQYHPARIENYQLEEIFAMAVMVSNDLFLGGRELAVWWTLLEDYGFDPRYEFIRTLYFTAFAAKEALQFDGIIDPLFVENNFVENFRTMYFKWVLDKDFPDVIAKTKESSQKVLKTFLNRDLNYTSLVDTINHEEHATGTFDNFNGGFNVVVKGLLQLSEFQRVKVNALEGPDKASKTKEQVSAILLCADGIDTTKKSTEEQNSGTTAGAKTSLVTFSTPRAIVLSSRGNQGHYSFIYEGQMFQHNNSGVSNMGIIDGLSDEEEPVI